jgi:hypothetical protein
VKGSPKKRARPLPVGLCMSLCAAALVMLSSAAWAWPEGSNESTPKVETESGTKDQSGPASDQPRPRKVTPPRGPPEHGVRVALVGGANILTWAEYSYDTHVSMPEGQQLHYAGTQSSPGVTVFAGGAVTLPGALRRVTVGGNLNVGGLDSLRRPVIPGGISTPFFKKNLDAAIQNKYSSKTSWRPSLSPYIEHELGVVSGERFRAGYQYWRQLGSYEGSFPPTEGSQLSAAYNVRFKYSSHLFRFSVNNYLNSDDEDSDAPHSSKRKSGLIRQVGVLAGTHHSIIAFVGIGPFWGF